MDIQRLNQLFPQMLLRMEEYGYSKDYIHDIELGISLINKFGSDPGIESLEDLYNKVVALRYKEATAEGYKNALSFIYLYAIKGVFPGDHVGPNGFLSKKYSSYKLLCPDFKYFIDIVRKYEIEHVTRKNLRTMISACSTFLYDLQKLCDIHSIEDIKEEHIQKVFSCTNNHRNACCSIRRALLDVENYYPSNLCRKISYMLPKIKRKHKLYDYLKPDEAAKLTEKILDSNHLLSYRDRAIMKIAYYTGMRRSDITALCFENIDEKNDTFNFVQKKTGVEMSIPYNSVIGQAILEYIIKERPESIDDSHVFLRSKLPFVNLTANAITNIANSFFKKIDFRQDGDRRRGLHLFRHLFVNDLINANIPNNIISSLVGHTSEKSLESYLDADVRNLRECAIDISEFEQNELNLRDYKCFAKDILNEYRRKLIDCMHWNSASNCCMYMFDSFVVERFQNIECLTQPIIDDFSLPTKNEYKKNYKQRMKAFSQFVSYINRIYKKCLKIPDIQDIPRNLIKSKKYAETKCAVSPLIKNYKEYCAISECWSRPKVFVLHSFEEFCHDNYNLDEKLNQDMIDNWCIKRDTEDVFAWVNRVTVVNGFIKYVCKLHDYQLSLIYIRTPKAQKFHDYHQITKEELHNFFYACDHFQYQKLQKKYAEILVLVDKCIFRLLLSTGMRTKEARELDRVDVDLKYGVINIRHTKGYIEHRIALDKNVLGMLVSYDSRMDHLMPDRKCFFPNINDSYLSNDWLHDSFRRFWKLFNDTNVTAYSFRHNYATYNINHFSKENFEKNLYYLSKSMGHSTVETTMYYYHFTRFSSTIITELKEDTIKDVITNRLNFFYDEN